MHTASENKGVGSSVVEHVLSKNIKVVMLAQPEDLDPRARFTLFYPVVRQECKIFRVQPPARGYHSILVPTTISWGKKDEISKKTVKLQGSYDFSLQRTSQIAITRTTNGMLR